MNEQLASEKVVVSAPMSFAGSAQRLWKPVRRTSNPAVKILVGTLMALTITMVWIAVVCWYLIFGLFLVPYRLIRRGDRKRRRSDLQHRETLDALGRQQQQQWG